MYLLFTHKAFQMQEQLGSIHLDTIEVFATEEFVYSELRFSFVNGTIPIEITWPVSHNETASGNLTILITTTDTGLRTDFRCLW
ncbi:hypothetical protein BGS_1238 [Beggiatoa sp. SS]|nr:hypothetical protein BGS_1238 [Beggiatoa sp. SS]